MKIFSLALTLFTLCAFSFAQAADRPFADFKKVFGSQTISGKESKNQKCKIRAQWQKNGDLKITGMAQYKKNKPKFHTVVFSTSKNVEYDINHGANDDSEYSVSQSKTLKETEDESVSLVESFTVNQDASGTTYVSLSVMEVNDHSDPSEIFVLHCGR